MERLNRGVVAVSVTGGVYVGWRMFGFEYDAANPANISYNVYRNGTMVANVTNSTNYLDSGGTASSTYTVRAVIGGTDRRRLGDRHGLGAAVPAHPADGPGGRHDAVDLPDGERGLHVQRQRRERRRRRRRRPLRDHPQVGSLEREGQLAVGLHRQRLHRRVHADGTRLWRIDLGPNIRAGAHYSQFVVIDADGDGKAEMAVKTAPGTKDASGNYIKMGPAASATHTMIYRNSDGYILSGPEYLTVFNGQTGAEMATVDFPVQRGTVSSWGDSYGNRVDRFLATAAYVDTTGLPSFIMARGYYTRTTLSAMNWRGGQLTKLWEFDSNTTPKDAAGHNYSGQGSHSMTVANVDDDPSQELMYGAMAVDNTGAGLCSTGYNHGDAEHVGDLIPSRPGLEMFMCNEDGDPPRVPHPRRAHLRDHPGGADQRRRHGPLRRRRHLGVEPGRGDVGVQHGRADSRRPRTPTSGRSRRRRTSWSGGTPTRRASWRTARRSASTAAARLLSASGCASNNGTKSTPALTADLYGDWREEVIWRESNSSALRLYTTTNVTTRRIYTLMHDAQYRVQVSAEQTAYNQPPAPRLPHRQRHGGAARTRTSRSGDVRSVGRLRPSRIHRRSSSP